VQIVGKRLGDAQWPERINAILLGHEAVVDVAERVAEENTCVVDEYVDWLPVEFLAKRLDSRTAADVDAVDDPDIECRQLIRGLAADSDHVIATRGELRAELQPDSSVCTCYQYGCHGGPPSCVFGRALTVGNGLCCESFKLAASPPRPSNRIRKPRPHSARN
jgi:hypothetical protein